MLMERYDQDEERLDWRAALICSMLANIYRDTKKHPEPFTPWDIIPRHRQEVEKELTPEESLAEVQRFAISLGADVVEVG